MVLTFGVEGNIGRCWILHLVPQIIRPGIAHIQIGSVQPAGVQHEGVESVRVAISKT